MNRSDSSLRLREHSGHKRRLAGMPQQMTELVEEFQPLQLGRKTVVDEHAVHSGRSLNRLASDIQIVYPDIEPLRYVIDGDVRRLADAYALVQILCPFLQSGHLIIALHNQSPQI